MDKVTISYQDKDGDNQSYIVELKDSVGSVYDRNIVDEEDKVIGYSSTRATPGYILNNSDSNEINIESSVTFIEEYINYYSENYSHACYKIKDENGNLLSSLSLDFQINLTNDHGII